MTSLALAHHPAAPFNAIFYAAIAAVIPVLFIALAIQGGPYEGLLREALRSAHAFDAGESPFHPIGRTAKWLAPKLPLKAVPRFMLYTAWMIVSGKLARRPQWDACLDYVRPGDVLVTVRLDRIGRSVKNLIDVVEQLSAWQVDLIVLDQAIDTTTPAGQMLFHILAAVAQFERDLIAERTRDGLAAARARGRVGGRKRKLTDAQVRHARELYDAVGDDGKRAHTVEEIGKLLGVDRVTVYRSLERESRESRPAV